VGVRGQRPARVEQADARPRPTRRRAQHRLALPEPQSARVRQQHLPQQLRLVDHVVLEARSISRS